MQSGSTQSAAAPPESVVDIPHDKPETPDEQTTSDACDELPAEFDKPEPAVQHKTPAGALIVGYAFQDTVEHLGQAHTEAANDDLPRHK